MLRNLADLRRFTIDAVNGELGTIHDFLFDDHAWVIRYFVVDAGPWLMNRRVLLSPVDVARADWTAARLRMVLTRDQIREAPAPNVNPPVSRQEEERLVAHYAWPAYWGMPAPAGAGSAAQRRRMKAEVEAYASGPRDDDPHLRSVREVVGYEVMARGGPIGDLADFVVDDADWTVRYLAVELPEALAGRRVLVAPPWVGDVDWHKGTAKVEVDRRQVEQAPPHDPSGPVTRAYERELHEAFGRTPYWDGGG